MHVRLEVLEVVDKRTMSDFFRLPHAVYRDCPHWVAPITSEVRRVLDDAKNPYFADGNIKMFACYQNGFCVARVAVVINRSHWQKYGSRPAFFGFFEAFDSKDAVDALFARAQEYAAQSGAESIEGPLNPNHYSEIGFQANEFDTAPAFFQPCNPEYYLRLCESAGFRPIKWVHTRKNPGIHEFILAHHAESLDSSSCGDYVVRSFDKKDFEAELERIREVFNDAFEHNWHFLPLSQEEYLFSAKFLNLVTYPNLITIVERNGEPVGVLECIPDVNPLLRSLKGKVGPLKFLNYQMKRKRVRNLIVYAVGIKKRYQKTRVHKLLFDALCRIAVHYDSLETTWMSPDNQLSIRAAEHFGLEKDKEFVIYSKSLPASK